MLSPAAMPASTRIPGPEGSLELHDGPRAGREVCGGILRAESDLHRAAPGRWRDTWQPVASRDADLPLDEVEAVQKLRDPVLDLEPWVHFEEVERPVARNEELACGDSHISRRLEQADRRLAHLARQLIRDPRGRRFLDHLLMASLHRAVAQPQRKHSAVLVGRQLHFDVTRRANLRLEEKRAVSERVCTFRGGAVEGGFELGRLAYDTNAAPSAPRRRLQHEWEADALGVPQHVRALDRTAAPRDNRNVDLRCELLGANLVTEQTHGRRGRSEKDQL